MPPERLELSALRLKAACSDQLSYGGVAELRTRKRKWSPRIAVVRRWQFAQRISHSRISLAIVARLHPCHASCVTGARFGPMWSNSRTTVSRSRNRRTDAGAGSRRHERGSVRRSDSCTAASARPLRSASPRARELRSYGDGSSRTRPHTARSRHRRPSIGAVSETSAEMLADLLPDVVELQNDWVSLRRSPRTAFGEGGRGRAARSAWVRASFAAFDWRRCSSPRARKYSAKHGRHHHWRPEPSRLKHSGGNCIPHRPHRRSSPEVHTGSLRVRKARRGSPSLGARDDGGRRTHTLTDDFATPSSRAMRASDQPSSRSRLASLPRLILPSHEHMFAPGADGIRHLHCG